MPYTRRQLKALSTPPTAAPGQLTYFHPGISVVELTAMLLLRTGLPHLDIHISDEPDDPLTTLVSSYACMQARTEPGYRTVLCTPELVNIHLPLVAAACDLQRGQRFATISEIVMAITVSSLLFRHGQNPFQDYFLMGADCIPVPPESPAGTSLYPVMVNENFVPSSPYKVTVWSYAPSDLSRIESPKSAYDEAHSDGIVAVVVQE